jgi:hypothetical protein
MLHGLDTQAGCLRTVFCHSITPTRRLKQHRVARLWRRLAAWMLS